MTGRSDDTREASGTRPWVDAFADEMEAKLAENRHKGDREGWARETVEWLFDRLQLEVCELKRALDHIRDDEKLLPHPAKPAIVRMSCEAVVRECADVANFAMMIADVAGGMQPSDQSALASARAAGAAEAFERAAKRVSAHLDCEEAGGRCARGILDVLEQDAAAPVRP